jgi:UDP-glucose 4-epimerase
MGDKDLPIVFTGIRPGEKVHEIMVSEENVFRTVERGDYYVICRAAGAAPGEDFIPALDGEYSSKDNNITVRTARTAG